MRIAIASDHTGFDLLPELTDWLVSLGHQCQNFGPTEFRAEDDYPDYVNQAAAAVAQGICEVGIIIGGSGQGEAMVANRLPKVRCAVFYGTAVPRRPIDIAGHTSRDPYEVLRLSRQHNDANILCLGAEKRKRVSEIVDAFLTSEFEGGRHQPRVDKIRDMEG